MRTSMALAAALLVVPVAAQAQALTATGNTNAGERICRAQRTIGSRLAVRRVCKTQAEWDEMERTAQTDIREAQTRNVNRTVDWQPGQMNGAGPGPH